MAVLAVTYKIRPESAPEVERGIAKMMVAIDREQPEGLRYAMGRLPDGLTFLGVLALDEGVDNPLPEIPAAREYQQNLTHWVAGEPPTPRPLRIVGSYRLFT